jgi:UDP-3-O-[3-hydroxymyristoyl] N-acetylglucosamine deacetylase
MIAQTTIANPVQRRGVGLHSGQSAVMTLRPAPPGTGIAFVRADISDRDNRIAASALGVTSARLGTNVSNSVGVSVATVEHFLAACFGMGLDNVEAVLDGPEAPIFDGSSRPWCELIGEAGLTGQGVPARALCVLKPVEVREGDKWVRLSPGEGFSAHVTIDFPSRAIGRQEIRFHMTPGAFAREVAFARTFGFAHEVEKLRAIGLARGGSMDNALVIDGDTVLNPEGVQVPDEFVRHKLLDVIGDLYLAGGRIEGAYEGEQPGHALNNRLLRALFADPASHAWRELD